MSGEPSGEHGADRERIDRLKALQKAERALERGNAEGVAEYLRETPSPDRRFLLELADVLVPGPHGHPDWRLVFQHRRPGNPKSSFDTEWNLYVLGKSAERFHARAKRMLKSGSLRKRVNGRLAQRYNVSDAQVEAALKWYRQRFGIQSGD